MPRRPVPFSAAFGARSGLLALCVSTTLAGCSYTEKKVIWDSGYAEDGAGGDGSVDADGDGSPASEDCDDTDPTVYPGADELCDGKNNDCDAGVDEQPVDGRLFYGDADGDGYGDPNLEVMSCERSPGFIEQGGDCDDTNELVNPDAEEICNDGIDNNCNGDDEECGIEGNIDLEDAALTLVGASGGDHAGAAVAIVGDMNGDGVGELAVGAPRADLRGADSGGVYLIQGTVTGTMSVDAAPQTALVQGSSSSHQAGGRMAGGVDLDSDGYGELFVGATSANGGGIDSGEAYLFFGPLTGASVMADADLKVVGEFSYDEAGQSLAFAGDVTGDGVGDLLVGSEGYGDGGYSSRGAVYLVSGEDFGSVDLANAEARIEGAERLDRLGSGAGTAGDVTGDGIADVVVSGWTYPDNGGLGGVFVMEGPMEGRLDVSDALVTITGEAAGDYLGKALATGDMDGDGYAELAAGAPGVARSAGRVYIFDGPVDTGTHTASIAVATVDGAASDDGVGLALAADGDFDVDGQVDLMVGSPGDDRGAEDAGAAGLFYGPLSGGHDIAGANLRLYGDRAGAGAGVSVSIGGDINGDAIPDLVVGGNLFDGDDGAGGASLTDRGAVWVITGVGI